MRKSAIIMLLFVGLFDFVQAQKGAISIAAGPLFSIPAALSGGYTFLKPGGGLAAVGQYSLSNKSALLLQISLAGYRYKYDINFFDERGVNIFSLQGGYKYQLGSAGYFINGLAGIDSYSDYDGSSIAFALGAGKRFIVKKVYFIDAGVDYMFGDTDSRFNIKAVFSLLRRPKVK